MSAALFSMMPDSRPLPATPPSPTMQFATFLAIGAAGAGGFVALSSLVTQLSGAQGWPVNALCYALLIVPAYLAHRRFAFQSALPHIQTLPRYVGVQLLALGLAALFSYVDYSLLGMHSVGSPALVIAVTAALNFAVLRNWAFSPKGPMPLPALRQIAHE